MLRLVKRARELAPSAGPSNVLLHSLTSLPKSRELPTSRHNHLGQCSVPFSTSSQYSAQHKDFSRHSRHKKRLVRPVAKRHAEEAALRSELTALERKVVQLDKRAEARARDEAMGPIGEVEIETLYEALMAPEELKGIEGGRSWRQNSARRIALARQQSLELLPEPEEPPRHDVASDVVQKRAIDSSPSARSQMESLPKEVNLETMSRTERVQHRLLTLRARLAALNEILHADGPDSSRRVALASEAEADRKSLASRMRRFLDGQHHSISAKVQGGQEVLAKGKEREHDTEQEWTRSRESNNSAGGFVSPPTSWPSRYRKVTERPYEQVIEQLDGVITQSLAATGMAESTSISVVDGTDVATDIAPLPMGIATMPEWTALAVSCAQSDDDVAFARILSLMQRSGYFPPPVKFFNNVMEVHAENGRVEKCEEVLGYIKDAGLQPDSHTHHCLIKARIRAHKTTEALELLSEFESKTPAALPTYTYLIHHLLQRESPEVQSTAWSVYHRMRFAAHPVPDAPLYGVMIRACARGVLDPSEVQRSSDPRRRSAPPDALRALDLFREMTTRYGIRPNVEVYSAVILACARSKDHYLEAFRLFGEMVKLEQERVKTVSLRQARGEDLNRDQERYQRFSPDRFTFEALLQGCARNGDLPRARWVLAEMLRSTAALYDGTPESYIDKRDREEMYTRRPTAATLALVMWTYASYKPLYKRGERLQPTANVDDQDGQSSKEALSINDRAFQGGSANDLAAGALGDADHLAVSSLAPEEAIISFTQQVPRTPAQVVSEARALMARIIADQPDGSHEGGPLGCVQPSPRLALAYLSVLRTHLPRSQRLRALVDAIWGTNKETSVPLFEQLGLEPTGEAYAFVMSQCALEGDRELADKTMDTAWAAWSALEDRANGRRWSPNRRALLDSQTISQAWANKIASLAKSNRLDEAIKTLRKFVTKYPPPPNANSSSRHEVQNVQRWVPPPSSKTPAVMTLGPFTPSHEIAEMISRQNLREGELEGHAETPRPALSFTDLQLLHHRLVVAGRLRPRGFIKWVDHAYRGSGLEMRRQRDVRYKEKRAATDGHEARWPNSDVETSLPETAADIQDEANLDSAIVKLDKLQFGTLPAGKPRDHAAASADDKISSAPDPCWAALLSRLGSPREEFHGPASPIVWTPGDRLNGKAEAVNASTDAKSYGRSSVRSTKRKIPEPLLSKGLVPEQNVAKSSGPSSHTSLY